MAAYPRAGRTKTGARTGGRDVPGAVLAHLAGAARDRSDTQGIADPRLLEAVRQIGRSGIAATGARRARRLCGAGRAKPARPWTRRRRTLQAVFEPALCGRAFRPHR